MTNLQALYDTQMKLVRSNLYHPDLYNRLRTAAQLREAMTALREKEMNQ